jgi:hypothetical protein
MSLEPCPRMTNGDWIESAASIRRELDPAIFAVVSDLMRKGWRLRRQGHKFRMYCTCPDAPPGIRVDGTPRNPSRRAVQIERQAAHCPNQHDLDRH